MSRAKMFKINTEKLRRLLEIAGGPTEVSERMNHEKWHMHQIMRRGTISRISASELEAVTKIQLIDYKEDGEYTDKDEHQIKLIMEALRRYDKKKERTTK